MKIICVTILSRALCYETGLETYLCCKFLKRFTRRAIGKAHAVCLHFVIPETHLSVIKIMTKKPSWNTCFNTAMTRDVARIFPSWVSIVDFSKSRQKIYSGGPKWWSPLEKTTFFLKNLIERYLISKSIGRTSVTQPLLFNAMAMTTAQSSNYSFVAIVKKTLLGTPSTGLWQRHCTLIFIRGIDRAEVPSITGQLVVLLWLPIALLWRDCTSKIRKTCLCIFLDQNCAKYLKTTVILHRHITWSAVFISQRSNGWIVKIKLSRKQYVSNRQCEWKQLVHHS